MKLVWSALAAGLVFGLGLGISGMTQADKVIGFLDLADQWDPSLAFVMVGAIAVHLVLFRLILRRDSPVFAGDFGIPSRSDIDGRLVGGAAIFGIGWALGGYCPGPGLVSMTSGASNAIVFVLAMMAGMNLFRLYSHAVDMSTAGMKPEERAEETAQVQGEDAEQLEPVDGRRSLRPF